MTNQVQTSGQQSTGSAPYAVRQINLTFLLGTGSFGASGQNSMTLTGLRVIAQIERAGGPSTGPATIRVYGLTPDQINQLSRCGLVYQGRENYVLVQAGDSISGMTTVFKGLIVQAYPDFNTQAESPLVITAYSSTIIQLKPVNSTSFPGQVPASQVFQQLAQDAGLTLQNGGVSATLSSPYFAGSTWDKIKAAARACNCFYYVDLATSTLAIWDKTGNRPGKPAIISAQNGMIGYPTFEFTRIRVRTLFNPSILPTGPGNQIQVISNLTPNIPFAAASGGGSSAGASAGSLNTANGLWTIVQIDYNLASQMPGGPWEMTITAAPTGGGANSGG